jgi:uncharacterized protein
MILPKDIQQKAIKGSVRDTQIEKDYVLSWILYGISQNQDLYKCLVFKGGTVLKKVYFEDYRYSEDLDFTLINEQRTDEFILQCFHQVFEVVLESCNLPIELIKTHVHMSGSINFQLSYKGPLGGQGNYKRVKVDITRGEKLIFTPVCKNILLTYKDLSEFSLPCYPLEEVFIEKLCALMGRTEPRDLYDLWYLLEIAELEGRYYWSEFVQKAQHKGHDPNNLMHSLEKKLPSFKSRWEGSLSTQIHSLPAFNQVARELAKHLRMLKG